MPANEFAVHELLKKLDQIIALLTQIEANQP